MDISDIDTALDTLLAELFDRLAPESFGTPGLICGCADCMSAEMRRDFARQRPVTYNHKMVGWWFDAAKAFDHETGEPFGRGDSAADYRPEARAMFLCALRGLVQSLQAEQRAERKNKWRLEVWYAEPDFWLKFLLVTGFLDELEAEDRARIDRACMLMIRRAIATRSAFLHHTLSYLGLFTPGLPAFLESLAQSPRQRITFWALLGAGAANSPAGLQNDGRSNFYRDFPALPKDQVALLCAALEDPGLGKLLERAAFAAREKAWFSYLSRLISWRENTILVHRYSDP